MYKIVELTDNPYPLQIQLCGYERHIDAVHILQHMGAHYDGMRGIWITDSSVQHEFDIVYEEP